MMAILNMIAAISATLIFACGAIAAIVATFRYIKRGDKK